MIAIDGPAGAGKSTVARAVAERLGFAYLDTGAMYRALTWLALERGIATDDEVRLGALAREEEIGLERAEDGLRVAIGSDDVTAEIRAPEIAGHVSAVAAHGAVRRAMVAAQRRITASGSWVADGRDVGTAVRPDAELKIFLVADVAVRAQRRHADLVASGSTQSLAAVRANLEERDHLDSTRAESPLRAADDAVEIDTSHMGFDAVVDDVARRAESAEAR